jgi:anti-sigma factor RsiW
MTDDPRLLELIQADLDGRLDGAEKAELARRLLADPAARRLHDELRQTDALLRDLPQAQPPDELTSAIRDSLGLSDHDRGGRRVADGGVGFRLAAAVVAGLVVVGLGYGLLSERRDTTDLQGSIAQSASAPVLVDEATLTVGSGAVTVRLFREGSIRTRLTVESSGAGEVQVVGYYDPLALTRQSDSGRDEQAGRFAVVVAGTAGSESIEFIGVGAIRLEVAVGSESSDTVILGQGARD